MVAKLQNASELQNQTINIPEHHLLLLFLFLLLLLLQRQNCSSF
jgi:hypothetical protein